MIPHIFKTVLCSQLQNRDLVLVQYSAHQLLTAMLPTPVFFFIDAKVPVFKRRPLFPCSFSTVYKSAFFVEQLLKVSRKFSMQLPILYSLTTDTVNCPAVKTLAKGWSFRRSVFLPLIFPWAYSYPSPKRKNVQDRKPTSLEAEFMSIQYCWSFWS